MFNQNWFSNRKKDTGTLRSSTNTEHVVLVHKFLQQKMSLFGKVIVHKHSHQILKTKQQELQNPAFYFHEHISTWERKMTYSGRNA